MPRTFKDLIRKIERDGWYLVAQNGNHRQYKHPYKKGRVTIAAHKLSDNVSLKTEKASYNKLGLFNLREVIPCTRIILMSIFSLL